MRADLVAAHYKIRWEIELLFKQLKQNFPLKYILGDNENTIKLQILLCINSQSSAGSYQKTGKKVLGIFQFYKFLQNPTFN
jgi:hypothetical protein